MTRKLLVGTSLLLSPFLLSAVPEASAADTNIDITLSSNRPCLVVKPIGPHKIAIGARLEWHFHGIGAGNHVDLVLKIASGTKGPFPVASPLTPTNLSRGRYWTDSDPSTVTTEPAAVRGEWSYEVTVRDANGVDVCTDTQRVLVQ
jgi:hypothetical protein